MERLLIEFPWLWAVSPSWSSDDGRVQVKSIHGDELYRKLSSGWTLWVESTWDFIGRSRTVRALEGDSNNLRTYAEIAVSLCTPGYQIQHLVLHEGALDNNAPFYIYRSPKGIDLDVMCRARANV